SLHVDADRDRLVRPVRDDDALAHPRLAPSPLHRRRRLRRRGALGAITSPAAPAAACRGLVAPPLEPLLLALLRRARRSSLPFEAGTAQLAPLLRRERVGWVGGVLALGLAVALRG